MRLSTARAGRGIVGVAAALGLGAGPAALAHDFWLQPGGYVVDAGSATGFTLEVGHGADRQRSQIPPRRIVRFVAIGPDGKAIDLRDGLDLGGATADGRFRLDRPGTYVLALETDDAAQSHLPAARFNRYLAEEGLTPAIERRRLTGRTNDDGSEIYGRRTKAIVRVGAPDPRSPSRHVAEAVGMTLEIVPEVDPLVMRLPAELPIRVVYAGRPLAGAQVKLVRLDDDAVPLATRRTDAAGRARFAIPSRGPWLMNVVWTRPRGPGATTDFETIFSSLSFSVADD